MYSIKREKNNLWEMIFPLIEREKIKIDKLQECKSSENLRKYDKEKFAVFLMKEETGSKLYEATKANVIINKNVVDLHEWLTNPKILLEKIEIDERAIKHNITTIYRLRNDLVHNGAIIDRNIQNKIDTFRYYINCILGTLIHHTKRNPELTIEEILNSILVTYDNYINNLKELKKKTDNIHKKIKEKKYKNNDKDNYKKEEIKLIEELEKTIIEFGIENIAYAKYLYM